MKNTLIVLILTFSTYCYGQKAYGPIEFGMSKKEVKTIARSAENMRMIGGQVHTEILGQKYFGTLEFDNLELAAIGFQHFTGNTAAYNHNYSMYTTTFLEKDINELMEFFTTQYGERYSGSGFVHPRSIDISDAIICGAWQADGKTIYLREVSVNAVTYPQIIIYNSEYLKQKSEQHSTSDKEDTEETKKMF